MQTGQIIGKKRCHKIWCVKKETDTETETETQTDRKLEIYGSSIRV